MYYRAPRTASMDCSYRSWYRCHHCHWKHRSLITLHYFHCRSGTPAYSWGCPQSIIILYRRCCYVIVVTFDPHLSFSNNISNLSRSCFMHIPDLRRIRPILDSKTASTISTCIVHSKLDYCNSLFLNLDSTQIQRLQLIQNSLARAVTRTPRHHHITPVLKSLHWLKSPEHIHFKVLSL